MVFTPAQMEALTGLTVMNQRVWHREGYFHPEMDDDRRKGGHRRYTAFDLLHVSTVRAIAALGLPLSVAAKVAETCTDEMSIYIQGFARLSHEVTHPYVFVWQAKDTAPGAEGEWPGCGILLEDAPEDFSIVRLGDLRMIPRYSLSGGTVIIPPSLTESIPEAVRDCLTYRKGADE